MCMELERWSLTVQEHGLRGTALFKEEGISMQYQYQYVLLYPDYLPVFSNPPNTGCQTLFIGRWQINIPAYLLMFVMFFYLLPDSFGENRKRKEGEGVRR